MTGLEFERYVARLLKSKGYNNIRLTEEYDYGIDIIAEKDGIRWGIQVKRYSGLVSADAVRQVITALKNMIVIELWLLLIAPIVWLPKICKVQ